MNAYDEPAALTGRERIILAVGLVIASAIVRVTALLPSTPRSARARRSDQG